MYDYDGSVKEYIPRVVDHEIAEALTTSGALVLQGARAVGKTESSRQVASSELRLDGTDPRAVLAREQPATSLAGEAPRLLDEWQFVPEIWNEVRHAVDDRGESGQFILSGSAIPDDGALRHSGAGRFRRVMMRTMTLFETGESNGHVSLRSLLNGEGIDVVESKTTFEEVVRRIVVGGWPGWRQVDEQTAMTRALSYVEDISEHDFVQLAGQRRDPRRFTAYLRAMASLVAQPAAYTAITRRLEDSSNLRVGAAAVPDLHDFASRLYIAEDQPAWSPKLRSRTALLQTPKRHLADPSLAAALLGASAERLLLELNTLGIFFESQVVHDLRVYAQTTKAQSVFHYRDSKGRDEIDIVVEDSDGSWIAVEVKLGAHAVEEAANALHRVTAKIERPPTAMVIVVPTGVAYQRPDGIHVVPLTVLGP